MSIEARHSEPEVAPRPGTAVAGGPVLDGVVRLTPWLDPTAVLTAVQQLVASPEPAAVLTSLAAVCTPALADECWGTLLEAGATQPISCSIGTASAAGAEERPMPALGTAALTGEDQLTLGFHQSAWEHYPEFSGTMTWRWRDRDRPTRSDKVIARLLLDRAIDLVRGQRLELAVAVERDKAANLQLALVSNREIGQAIGILMATYKVTSQQGFDLLRTVSQHTHRKLFAVATEVCDTGMLVLPAPR